MAGKDLMTVHLGQFTRESANEIAGKLEEAEIAWWYKEPGFFSRIWEYGVRMFVDESRLEEAKGIAAEVVQRRAEAIEKRKGR
jgi:hypothetical protein